MAFQIHALDPARFKHLYTLGTSDLRAHRARWITVDAQPGFPCRISLEDAPAGTRVLLVNYCHLDEQSPYRAHHAIFVRPDARRAFPPPDVIPPVISSRLISWRAFDASHLMIDADVVDGTELDRVLPARFDDSNVAYIHLHNAKPGCFAASVTRA